VIRDHKFHGRKSADLNNMWVARAARGLGVGRRLLSELETQAARYGVRTARLETNKTLIQPLRSAGYIKLAPFNDEPYANQRFAKQIGSPRPPKG